MEDKVQVDKRKEIKKTSMNIKGLHWLCHAAEVEEAALQTSHCHQS